jgi:alpha-amylase/alpha-mannosidase (GH57 family)
MTSSKPVFLHIMWHQHQPWYVEPGSKRCVMPWVRLHGVKDYYDIAWLSKEYDGWKQTINLVPSLLEQLQRYTDGSLTDEYWELSCKPANHLTNEEKKKILQCFFDAHAPRMIHPFPRYDELFRKRGRSAATAVDRFSEQDIRDLQVWHNLSWIDPIWRENPDLPLRALIKKQKNFTEEDKHQVLDIQNVILKKIIPLHQELYNKGKIQLTCSPYYHPILPLLCDTSIAQVSNPHDPVPEPAFANQEDAEWQVREGVKAFKRIIGADPVGMWPSEGSVSDQACAIMAQEQVSFFASDEAILLQSDFIHGKTPDRSELYRLHRLETAKGEIDCVFRDHGLSDLIGFVYQNRDPKEAAKDFISHLKNIGDNWNDKTPPLVNVILDGENCWEFYARDGHDFLRYFIEGILKEPQVVSTTVPEYRELYPAKTTLKSIHPGSWINSNYRIWIGHQEHNAAWHFLRQAREKLVEKEDQLDEEVRATAWEMLHICEGSDWFWWYGDINSSQHDMLFDHLFRVHLIHLYEQIGEPAPTSLHKPIKQAKKVLEAGGILFRQPTLGRGKQGYYDWVGTQAISTKSGGGAMHQADEFEADIRYGRLNNSLSLHVSFKDKTPLQDQCQIRLNITKPVSKTITITPAKQQDAVKGNNSLEAVIDLNEIGLEEKQEAWFYLEFEPNQEPAFVLPHGGELYLHGYSASNASLHWFL